MHMKKTFFVLILILSVLLVACENAPTSNYEVESGEKVVKDIESNEDNEKTGIKERAIKADFVAINGNKVEKDTILHLTAEVGVIFGTEMFDEITVSTEENGGFGVYSIMNFADLEFKYTEGDIIDIWGMYDGKNDSGMPVIIAFIIEASQDQSLVTSRDDLIKEDKDFKTLCEENSAKHPAKAGAVLYNNDSHKEFKGMKYYFEGEIVGFSTIENNVGNPSIWLVKNNEGYVMPIQHEYFEAGEGDIVQVWGTLSGNGYAKIKGIDNVVGQTGSIHAMIVTVNGEEQY